jgi:isopropylmalate/homocitrate/citramalate synthase
MTEKTDMPWDVEGKWSVSAYGWSEEVRREFPLMRNRISIRDDTFREGDHCIGYRMSFADKIDMLRLSVEMGVEEIDIGGPTLHKTEFDLGTAMKESGIKVRKTARIFGNKQADFRREVDMCMEAGADNLRIVLMYLNEQKVLDELKKLPAIFDYVHSQHKTTMSWAISDAPRAPMSLIRKVYEEGLAAGGDKAGINDTFGVATPTVMRYLTRVIREIIPETMDLKAHCHNTYGLATANTLACAEGGATELDCCINGYGDEAGNAALEEVAVSLEALYGVDTGLDLSMLNRYSKLAEEKGKIPIQPHKAVVGENAFLRPMLIWSGVNMAKESWLLHEALDPECVGASSTVVFGPHQSLEDAPIEVRLKELGLPYTPADIGRVRQAVEGLLNEERTLKVRRKYVTEAEFDDVAKKLVRGPKG